MSYTPYFNKQFKELVSNKYSNIKKSVKNKVDLLIKSPLSGEPLKKDLLGLRSAPIKGNFILIYILCKECRSLKLDSYFKCSICSETSDESIVFIYLAPHDDAYKIAKKLVKKGKIYEDYTEL